jgi:transglutaminase-like putative cysteine protease
MKKLITGFFVCLTFCAIPVLGYGDDAPGWLRQAAGSPVATYDKKVAAVVLVDESTTTVDDDGKVVRVTTGAVRILTNEGRREAVAEATYDTDTGKVREIKAWMVRPSGQIKNYGGKDVIDEAEALNDVYDESRVKKISGVDDAEPGAVFGFQITTEERPFFNQVFWFFQGGPAPVISSRMTLVLPAGWRATGITLNHPTVEPTVTGTSYTWEVRNLPAMELEPAGPSIINIVPRLEIKYSPTEGAKSVSSKAFDSWLEISRWYTDLSAAQAVPDEKINAKARELTANAKTEFDRIRSIGSYVQSIQYISIQIGVGRWRPHSAAQVLAKSYGDCKDKANLMRALLKAVNIESFPVLIHSGDPTYVRDNWPSPYQFNHCIVAVKVGDETIAASVVNHSKLGRLLIFDATDDDTPVGDLPQHEQGSFALIAAGDGGSLEKMPVTVPEANSLDRAAEVQLAADGSIAATIRDKAVGQSAVGYRREFKRLSRPDYMKLIEGWVTNGASGAKVSKVEPSDNSTEGRFGLDVDFSAPSYAQLMQDRLLVFHPAIVSRRESLFLTAAQRKYPIVLNSRVFNETVRVKLPAGFIVDEMPDAIALDTSFGSYKTTYEVKNGELFFSRRMSVKAGTIPADQYETVRKFYEKIRAAEQSPVVLAKK